MIENAGGRRGAVVVWGCGGGLVDSGKECCQEIGGGRKASEWPKKKNERWSRDAA